MGEREWAIGMRGLAWASGSGQAGRPALARILHSHVFRRAVDGLRFVEHTNPSRFEPGSRKLEGLMLVGNLNPSSTLHDW